MNQTQIRIDGTLKRIEKLHAKIARLNGLIEKKRIKIASGKEENNKYQNGQYFLEGEIEWHERDIESAEKDLVREEKKLAEYREKRDKEIEKENSIPKVEAVEKFLQNWKDEARKFFTKELEEVEPFKESIKHLEWKKREEKIRNRFSLIILDLYQREPEERIKKLEKILTNEVNSKRADLFFRCSAVTGLITDASGLYVGDNLSLNGFVIGEEGKAEVKTIYAGGYNIQCLHYRVLVNKIK